MEVAEDASNIRVEVAYEHSEFTSANINRPERSERLASLATL